MNAAAKQVALGYGVSFSGRVFLTKQTLTFWLLLLVFLGSGMGVIYEKEIYRSHLTSLQQLQQEQEALHVQAKQLLLEQTSWATPHRISQVAESKLGMHSIEQKSVVLVRL